MLVGHIGDRLGRKRALFVSMMMMMVPTVAIGFLPTYHQIGIGATFLLALLRMIQGVAVGGEYVTALVFSMEHAPGPRKPFTGALMSVFVAVGTFTGSGVVALLRGCLTEEQMGEWGWRLSFWLGLAIGVTGLLTRAYAHDSPEFKAIQDSGGAARSPLAEVVRSDLGGLLRIVGIMSIQVAGWYQCFVWMVFLYGTKLPGVERAIPSASALNTAMQLGPSAVLVLIGLSGWDLPVVRATRAGIVAFGILAVPLYALISLRNFWAALAAQGAMAVFLGLTSWGTPYVMHSSFPAGVRVAALGLSYNVAGAVFGGTTPLICSALMWLGPLAPSLYLIFIALLSFSCLCLHERRCATLGKWDAQCPAGEWDAQCEAGACAGASNANGDSKLAEQAAESAGAAEGRHLCR